MLIERAQQHGLIKGLVSKFVENGLADDIIFLMQDDYESATNLKFILCLFEQMSGLKVTFRKSELYCFGEAVNKQTEHSTIFTCDVGSLPFKYLGINIDKKEIKQGLERH